MNDVVRVDDISKNAYLLRIFNYSLTRRYLVTLEVLPSLFRRRSRQSSAGEMREGKNKQETRSERGNQIPGGAGEKDDRHEIHLNSLPKITDL